jgi:hypothetical protein
MRVAPMPQLTTVLYTDNEKNSRAPCIVTDDPKLIGDFIVRYNKSPDATGIYLSINPVKAADTVRVPPNYRQPGNVECIERIGLDHDLKDYDLRPDELQTTLTTALLAPTHVHDSGGGFHSRWELKEAIYEDEDPELYARAVKVQNDLPHLLCADTMVCHPHSLLRMPETINTKYPDRGDLPVTRVGGSGNAVDLTELEEWCDILRDYHAPFLTKKEKPQATSRTGTIAEDDRDAEQILAEMAPGDIHNSQLRATAKLLARGVMIDDIVAQVLDATDATGDPTHANDEKAVREMCYSWIRKNPDRSYQLPEDLHKAFSEHVASGCQEIKFVYRKGAGWHVRGYAKSEPEEKEGGAAPFGGLVAYGPHLVKPLDWSIKGLLPRRGIMILPGQFGTYKSTTLYELAYSQTSGEPFAGKYKVKHPGAVIILVLEGGKDAAMIRLRAVMEHHGKGDQLAPIYLSEEAPPPLVSPSCGPYLVKLFRAAAELAADGFGVEPQWLAIDTYGAAAGHTGSGDDNDKAATQKCYSNLSYFSAQTGKLIIVIDHFGKLAEAGTMGSSAKEQRADAILANMGEKEATGTLKNARVVVRKQRNARQGWEIPFKPVEVDWGAKDEDGDPITAVALEFGEEREATKVRAMSSQDKNFIRALDETLEIMGIDYLYGAVTVKAVREDDLREVYYQHFPRGDGTEQQHQTRRATAFKRAVNKASGDKVITILEEGTVVFYTPDE